MSPLTRTGTACGMSAEGPVMRIAINRINSPEEAKVKAKRE